MFTTPDQFLALHKANLESLQALTASTLAGFERLTQLNLATTRASVEEATDRMKSMLDVKDVKDLAGVGLNASQPAAERLSTYAKSVYEIANETGTEIAKVIDQHFADGNRQLHSVIDAMARNAPAGSEGMVTFVKSAVSSAGTAYDQFNRASKQVAEMTEANIAAASRTISNGVVSVQRAA